MVQPRIATMPTTNETETSSLSGPLKEKWIAALRSGEFKQGVGRLKDGDSYCCLGVLACVAGFEIEADLDAVLIDGRDRSYIPFSQMLSDYDVLTSKNDNGATFTEIADYIEANIPAVDHSVLEAS